MNEQIKTVAGAPLFNPLAPEFIANPYPYYQRLRETAPMHLTPLGFYVASRHADIATVLRDKRFGKDFAGRMSRRHGPRFSRAGLSQHAPLDAAAGSARPHPLAWARGARLYGAAASRICAAHSGDRRRDHRPRRSPRPHGLDRRFRLPPPGHRDLRHARHTGGGPGAVLHQFAHRGRLLDPVPLSRAEIEQHNGPISRRPNTSIGCSSCAGASRARISRPSWSTPRSTAASSRTRS